MPKTLRSPEALIDDPRVSAAVIAGYAYVCIFPTGEVAGLQRMLFTVGLMVGIDQYGYRTRFCYKTASEAIHAIQTWDGKGDPPGLWVKEKGNGRKDRFNPRVFFNIPVVTEQWNPHE
jgi:hypothetical protein